MSKVKQTKIKSKLPVILVTLVIIFSIVISSFISIFQSSRKTYAEGLSPADTLLLGVVKEGFKKCINSGILTKNAVNSSDNYKEGDIFMKSSSAYKDDGTVLLPFKYGTANTVKDGNLSCRQLFNSYFINADHNNEFQTYTGLGGKGTPPFENGTVEEKNKFLEALGYVATTKNDSRMACAALTYSATSASTNIKRTTNKICINTDADGNIAPSEGNKITYKDVVVDNSSSDEYVGMTYDSSNNNINVSFMPATGFEEAPTSMFGRNCNLEITSVYGSQNLNTLIGQNARSFFSSFFNTVESNRILNEGRIGGYGYDDYGGTKPCSGRMKTLPEALGVTTIAANADLSDKTVLRQGTGDGTRLNDSLVKKYEYKGAPDYDKIMQYYVPAYTNPSTGITQREKAYNWYHILTNNFQGISVDENTKCSTQKPERGAAFLTYLKDSETEPGKQTLQYCPLDEPTLNLKAGEQLMDKAPTGKVNGINMFSSDISQMDARTALNYLNAVDLLTLCAADSSFPLCKATPIDCKSDPNKDGCKELAGNNASEEEDGANGESATCFANAGALGWMICPLMYTLRDAVQGIFNEFVEPLIRVDKSIVTNLAQNNDSSAMYKAWSLFRNMANIIFVIALLFVIFSQVTGFGIDNYGIKRLLPKLIVTAIIVNFSYFICGIVVDLSNLIGNSVRDIFENASRDLTFTAGTGSDGLGTLGVATGVATGVAAAVTSVVALVTAGAALSTAATSGGLLALILPVLGLAASAFMAGFFALLMLGARQAIIIIMIVTSPIAFVLYALPNTNALFKKWVSLFRGLLLLYPIYCFMVGGGFMAAKLIVKDSTGVFIQLIAGFISIAPYFAVPSMTRNALKGFDAAVNGIAKLQNRVNGGMQFAGKKIMNSETVKASAGNYEFGKQSKFAKKYDGYTQEQLAQLSPGKRRRLMTALGVVGKDAQQAATIGAVMSQFKHDTDAAGMARTARTAMDREDDRQAESLQSEYARQNLDHMTALAMLEEAQGFDYANASYEASRENDRKLRALQGHLLSTKEGQKAYNRYLSDGVAYESYTKNEKGEEIGEGQGVSAVKSSTRAKAVLARDFVSKRSDLKKDFGVTYTQMQSMQGSGTLESMNGSADAGQIMSNERTKAVNKYVQTMDSIDMQNLSKADAKELNSALATKDDKGNSIILDSESSKKLKNLSDQVVNVVSNDPSRLGDYNDNLRDLIKSTSGTDLNSVGSRTMEIRNSDGDITHTISVQRPDQTSSQNSNQNDPTNTP
jgi:hypothetical protein